MAKLLRREYSETRVNADVKTAESENDEEWLLSLVPDKLSENTFSSLVHPDPYCGNKFDEEDEAWVGKVEWNDQWGTIKTDGQQSLKHIEVESDWDEQVRS